MEGLTQPGDDNCSNVDIHALLQRRALAEAPHLVDNLQDGG